MKTKMASLIFVLIFTIGLTTITFAAQYHFTPRFRATETYTDNVFLTDDNTEDDWITDVSPGFTFQVLGKKSGLDLIADPAYVTYADDSKDDTWRLPASLSIWGQPSKRTRLSLFNRFLRTEDPQENRAVRGDDGRVRAPGDTSVRRGRQEYSTNYAVGRVDHQFGSDDSVYGQFVYSLRREDESGPEANDNDRYSPSTGVTYWFGPKWGTQVDGTFTRTEFDNSPNYDDISGIFQLMRRFTQHFQLFGRYGYAYRDNEDISNYHVHAPSAGFIYNLAEDARISLGAGYYYQDFTESGEDSEEGPFFNGDAFKLWNYKRFTAQLLGDAGLDRNDFGSERLGFEWFAAITGNLSYDFTRNFYGTAVGFYRYSDYINQSREDSRVRLGAGLGWLPLQWMRLTLDYTFNMLDSTDVEDYDENRVVLRLTLQPDKPWRF